MSHNPEKPLHETVREHEEAETAGAMRNKILEVIKELRCTLTLDNGVLDNVMYAASELNLLDDMSIRPAEALKIWALVEAVRQGDIRLKGVRM